MRWTYERMKADLSVEECPRNDYDGSVTGQVGKAVFNVPAWLDEHPDAGMTVVFNVFLASDEALYREQLGL